MWLIQHHLSSHLYELVKWYVCIWSELSVCSIAPCIYSYDQTCSLTSVKTGEWGAFVINKDHLRLNTAPLRERERPSSWVKRKSVFYLKCFWRFYSPNKTWMRQFILRRLTIFPCLCVSVVRVLSDFTDPWYMTHKLPSDAKKKEHFMTVLFSISASECPRGLRRGRSSVGMIVSHT